MDTSGILQQEELVKLISIVTLGIGKYIFYGIVTLLLGLFISKKASTWFTNFMMRKKDHKPFNKETMVYMGGEWWWLESHTGEYVVFARANPDFEKAHQAGITSEKPLLKMQIPIDKYISEAIIYK